MKRLLSFFLLALLSLTTVTGHGSILYDVSLDFDSELKKTVLDAAKEYLDVDEEPRYIDLNREMIVVRFDRELELSVDVDPRNGNIMGFRDDSQSTHVGEKTFTSKQTKEIAQKVAKELPKEYVSQLYYTGETELYSGLVEHSWHRFVDGLVVFDEYLKVEVNPSTGKVVAWRASHFFYPTEQIRTAPAFSHKVAQYIAQLQFNGQPIEGIQPHLVIIKNRPVWIAKVKVLYPSFVAIDAEDGEVLFSGSLRGDMPKNYDRGRDKPVKETNLIKEIYGGKT